MTDDTQNARHRIDLAKVLNDFAANGPQGAPAADRFVINIQLGADVLKYDRSIEINPNDVDPHHLEDVPQVPFPVKTSKVDEQW